jgi:glycosyltransferase involved in cell wall biosynthesis
MSKNLQYLESLGISMRSLTQNNPILLVSHQATLTGAPRVLADLGRAAAQIGANVLFLFVDGGVELESYSKIGQVYLLSQFNNSFDDAANFLILNHGPSVAVFNTITTTHYVETLKRLDPDIKCIGWIHELPTVINSFFGGRATAVNANTFCDKLAFGSDYVRQQFADEYGVDGGTLCVLPYIWKLPMLASATNINSNSAIPASSCPEEPNNDKTILLIGCGTAEPRKGLDIFIRVARHVLDNCQDEHRQRIKFEWHGCPSYSDNYVDFCKFDAKRLGIDEFIEFKPVSGEFAERLAMATAFMLTSREDPYPLVILDSMANGVPFVCFEEAGGAASIANSGAGIAIPYGDEQLFAAKINYLIDNPVKCEKLGRVGKKKVILDHNKRHVLETFVGLLEGQPSSDSANTYLLSAAAGNHLADQGRIISNLDNDFRDVLVISFGPPPLKHMQAVEGGGLRCWNLAKGMQEARPNFAVTLMYPSWYDTDERPDEYDGVKLVRWKDRDDLLHKTSHHEVIVISFCYGDYSLDIANSLSPSQILVLDCYVPIHVEMCARRSPDRLEEAAAYELERERWDAVLCKGSFFLCANSNQIHYYRGILHQIGRLNPVNYDNDPLILAPFGISRDLPVTVARPIQALGIMPGIKKLLWFGGVYPWFNVKVLFDAVAKLNSLTPCVLIVVGVRNPFNSHPLFVSLAAEIEAMAQSAAYAGLIHLVDWVQYKDRANWYLDSDLTVMISQDGVENNYAWRTRLVDYIWADSPVATSGQDLLSQKMIELGIATKLDMGTAEEMACSLANAFAALPSMHINLRENGHILKESLYIDSVGARICEALVKSS